MEDGIVDKQTIFNTYGDNQPDKTTYSLFNGMLKLVITKNELIDEHEFNQIKANNIMKVHIHPWAYFSSYNLADCIALKHLRYRTPQLHQEVAENSIGCLSSLFAENMNLKN